MDVVSYLLGKQAGGGGEVNLQEKSETITTNTTTNITPDEGYDGLSKVTVTTNVSGGVDLSDYFVTEITSDVSSYTSRPNYIKKTPVINVASNVTILNSAFYEATIDEVYLSGGGNLTNIGGLFSASRVKKVDFSNMDLSNVTTFTSLFSGDNYLTSVNFEGVSTSSATNMSNMFVGCTSLRNLNLSSFTTSSVTNFSNMFYNCSVLRTLDIRNFTFDGNSGNPTYTDMFTSFNSSCRIIVKSDTEKNWISTRFPNLTNIVTVAEL